MFSLRCSLPLFRFHIPSSWPGAPAQLALTLATEHAIELQLEGLAFIQVSSQRQGGNMPSPGGVTVHNCQVQAEPQAQTPAYLTLYTYPCSSQPSQNEPLLTTACTLNCKGN